MKCSAIALVLATAAVAASAQPNVGVSVQVNQPGVYGRIDIGNVPQPPVLVYQQPVVIAPSPVAVHQRPIYLHVPPGYERNWGRYCGRYGACGQPVYFVREDWYQRNYRPVVVREQERHHGRDWNEHGRGPGHGHGHGHGGRRD